ncbi:NXPE family member 4-like [Branchiostoma floridae x Branchiostoma belcheri]
MKPTLLDHQAEYVPAPKPLMKHRLIEPTVKARTLYRTSLVKPSLQMKPTLLDHQAEYVPAPKPLKKHRLIVPTVKPRTLYRTSLPLVKPFLQMRPTLLDQATNPNHTTIDILKGGRVYHQGDVLTVRVVARDKEGRPKTYGGDFFRARLVSIDRSPPSSSAGLVTDHGNGTYTVQFPLYWAGGVLPIQNPGYGHVLHPHYQIKIQLVHPSEAVTVLQRVREVPNKRVFHCNFVDVKTKATDTTQCFSSANPSLLPHQQCDFSKPEVNGTWICEKPDRLPCSTISKCWWNSAKVLGLLTQEEKKLFQKPYLEEELQVDLKETIHVLEAELPTPQHLPACTWDKSAALGHWSGQVWKSSVCNVRVFSKEDIQRCLANKTVYMQGDSTIRQWSQRLQMVVPLYYNESTMHFTALHGGDNSQWNISVRYQFHHYPVQARAANIYYDFRYVVETLDATPGGPNTVIVLSLWAHFTAEPLELLRSRLYAIRGAIHRLKRRSPGTKVFVRTGTTREHGGQLEFYLLGSDWLAYQITEVIREMFRADPDVVVLDTWDMSVCQPGRDNVHPDQRMVDSQLNTLLSHICPD